MARRAATGQPLVAHEPRRPVPWTWLDVVAVILVFLVTLVAGGVCLLAWETISPADAIFGAAVSAAQKLGLNVAALLVQSIASLSTILVAIVLLRRAKGVTWNDLGLSLRRIGYDARLGVLTFFAVALPVLGLLQFLVWLQHLVEPGEPTQHPIIVLLQQEPGAHIYVIAALAAVVVAPLAEEFFFRVLLQGWLETAGPDSSSTATLGDDLLAESTPPVRWRPIVLSSVLFAAVHLGQGLAPAPLFFFSLALGYLYQRTHRIWASAALHFSLNATSLTVLWLSLQLPKE
jgi:membrane protease YdiL (CAAX protease family)